MTDLADDKETGGPDPSEMHVNSHAPVANQQNIGHFYSGNRNPQEYLATARRALAEHQWQQACQRYTEYLAHEPSSSAKKWPRSEQSTPSPNCKGDVRALIQTRLIMRFMPS